ncbi:hypothetical protein COEREDRAFT_72141 [Coemansia reversa NRRL 1564]|uniref:Formamidopyrimidine-DNA glycosylase catalytic domain-containing protein n=1 Tax=Coemansia reversa (strain ATCC 12441 / NRRL 1564) TaxID=763665 RepID=A0A2G5BE84_COERN|nr:hypothetical protein COEREDRAFT_72141 [Coemansia reversa NRRL 1564]|eukprot:PIA17330.1 hypothetical protein COEREDRAFT_72141 [Coemansia reversa NRRL 1564]
MPELPVIERVCRLLRERIVGKKILKVYAANDPSVFSVTPGPIARPSLAKREVEALLRGRTVVECGRRGKKLWLTLSSGISVLISCDLKGILRLKGEPFEYFNDVRVNTGDMEPPNREDQAALDKWPPLFTKLELSFGRNHRMAYVDRHRLGRIRFFKGKPEDHSAIAELGLDPILDPPTPAEFVEMMWLQKRYIKSVLVSQKIFAGVGNWIADEVLFQSRVNPLEYPSYMSQGRLKVVLENLKYVCRTAVEANAESSLYPDDWLFHYRWRMYIEDTFLPNGDQVVFRSINGRITAYVPTLQKFGRRKSY